MHKKAQRSHPRAKTPARRKARAQRDRARGGAGSRARARPPAESPRARPRAETHARGKPARGNARARKRTRAENPRAERPASGRGEPPARGGAWEPTRGGGASEPSPLDLNQRLSHLPSTALAHAAMQPTWHLARAWRKETKTHQTHMHQPGIEPGSHRWQRCILPLDH